MRHSIVVNRHYKHKNNEPTPQGLAEVWQNAEGIKDQIPENIINPTLISSDARRTQGTARAVAAVIDAPITPEHVKDYLSIVPKNGPLKDILKKFSELYDVHPDVVAGKGYADDLVYKIQRNQLEGVNTKPFARFTTNKLYNAIQAIKRNPAASNLTIAGIHGGRWLETVLYTLWGDHLPKEREGQIRMGENLMMHVDIDDTTEAILTINYKGKSLSIHENEIKEKIDALKS